MSDGTEFLGFNHGSKPDRINRQRVAQFVSDVLVDVLDVSEGNVQLIVQCTRW